MNEPRDPALDASGHLSELSLDRVHLDARDSDPAFFARADAHLATCARCRAELDARVEADHAFAIGPPARPTGPARVVPLATARRARPGLALGVVGALAAAAAALFVTRPPGDGRGDVGAGSAEPAEEVRDTISLRGGALELQVQVKDDAGARAVVDGARVKAGDQVGFAVRGETAGYVMVVAWDDGGALYLAHPTSGDPEHAAATPLPAGAAWRTLPSAVQLDAKLGRERFAALWCPRAFGFAALAGDVPAADQGFDVLRARAGEGCALRGITLAKEPP